MSTTTKILFHSPALNCLKRDQLVKLCKIHNIKANGKNKDLIERLQLHAQTLPPDDPLSIATRSDKSEGEEDGERASTIDRPSEQWEVLMDSIAEVDEDATNTLKSNRAGLATHAGEFGTNASKASSVSSSLKAIATSLGLKRANASATTATSSSKSSLTSLQSGQSQSTSPTEQEPEVEPVPGQHALAGFPAPSNARLSISQDPATTTIRLVSSDAPTNALFSPPRLHPFKTSFDLAPPTPGGGEVGGIWPFSPGTAQKERIYPPIPTFSAFQPADASDMDIDVDFPGSLQSTTPGRARLNTGATLKSDEKPSDIPQDVFSPVKFSRAQEHVSLFRPQRSPEKPGGGLAIPRSEPFIFGSPNPQHRLSNAQFRSAAQGVLDEMNARLEAEGVAGVDIDVLRRRQQSMSAQDTEDDSQQQKKAGTGLGTQFDKAHQAQFDKMDSITNHYAARRSKPDAAPILGKRKSVAAPATITGKQRKSSVVVKKDRIPSTSSTKLCPIQKNVIPGGFGGSDESSEEEEENQEGDKRKSKRVRLDPLEDAERETEDEAKKLKEREAIRRKLDANKAKRRSSMGRPSLGRGVVHQPKPTSRFGFLSSAKNLVSNVWNRGAGGSKSSVPATKPAPAPAPALPTKPAVPSMSSKPAKEPAKAQSMTKKTSIIPSTSGAPPILKERVASVSKGKCVPSISSLPPVADSSIPSRSSRSQIPGLLTPGTSGRMSHSSATGVSSLGGASRANGAERASSIGMKTTLNGTLKGPTTERARARTSTLMAPTASSLAKKSRLPVPSFSPLQVKDKAKEKERQIMEQMTNSPLSPRTQGKIFSQPLAVMSPTPRASEGQMSLGAAAAMLSPVKPSMLPKPKVMLGRRPRISRGKVIAKLASQREAQQAGVGTDPKARGASKCRASVSTPKVRSSLSANVGRGRQSHGVERTSGDVLMSAKRRARRSEYTRRRSRVAGEKMNVES